MVYDIKIFRWQVLLWLLLIASMVGTNAVHNMNNGNIVAAFVNDAAMIFWLWWAWLHRNVRVYE